MPGKRSSHKHIKTVPRSAIAVALASATVLGAAYGHEAHGTFSAGQPGDPKKTGAHDYNYDARGVRASGL